MSACLVHRRILAMGGCGGLLCNLLSIDWGCGWVYLQTCICGRGGAVLAVQAVHMQ
jgi:hypothetical protein